MSPNCPLTTRELECVRGIADGGSQKSVARDLGISPHVVGSYLEKARFRTQIGTTAGLVALAIRKGWIE